MHRHLLLTLVLAGLSAAPSAAGAASAAGEPDPTPAEARLVERINAYRASIGVRRLPLSRPLMAEARWYARDMAVNNYFNHTHIDSLGRSFPARLRVFGILNRQYHSQITAAGSPDADPIFEGFRASPAHDARLRFPGWRSIAVGVATVPGSEYGSYWAVDFGPDDPRRPPRSFASVTIELPAPLRVVARPCADIHLDATCVRVQPRTRSPTARIEVQRRRHHRWATVSRRVRRTEVLVLGVGAVARVRVVAPTTGSAGPWRVFRGPEASQS
jgi:uncharacterized protein YkwD